MKFVSGVVGPLMRTHEYGQTCTGGEAQEFTLNLKINFNFNNNERLKHYNCQGLAAEISLILFCPLKRYTLFYSVLKLNPERERDTRINKYAGLHPNEDEDTNHSSINHIILIVNLQYKVTFIFYFLFFFCLYVMMNFND